MELFFTLLRYAAPVTFAALGETVGQKSGVINIGLEGLMLLAAFVSVDVSAKTGNVWLGLVSGILAALLMGMISAVFTITLAQDQVVVGTALNLVALGLTSTLFQAFYGATGKLLSVEPLPKLWGQVDLVLLSLPIAIVLIAFLLFKTKWGLALRAAGEYPDAVESSGFSVFKLRYQAQAIGCLLAGVAGSYLTLGFSPSFAENMTSGRGFVAIAMVTFGRWRPWLVVSGCLLVGFTEWLQFALQGKSPIPLQFFQALPYVVALGVLVFVGKGTVAPQHLAIPFLRKK